jgi:predicted nucleotidyltransferase
MLPDKVLSLAPLFGPLKAIEAVYVFGSYASGKAQQKSDLDLGIVCKPGTVSDEDKLYLLTEITRHGFDRIDLVLVDGSDHFLAHEVVKYHKLLFQKEDFDHPTFFSKVTRQYLDFLPTLKLQAEALKTRLATRSS